LRVGACSAAAASVSSAQRRDPVGRRSASAYDSGRTPPRPTADARPATPLYGSRVDPLQRIARVPARPPLSDLLIAAALTAWAVAEAFLAEGSGSVAVRILAGAAMTVPLALRRLYPLPVVLVVGGVLVLRAAVGSENEASASFFPAILLATFSVALYERRAALAIAGGPFALACVLGAVLLGFAEQQGTEKSVGNLAIISFFVGAAWTAGWLLRRRAEHARRVESESGELAEEAVADERARIARELHDIVAHSVSIISVQAGAAEQYLDRDPERARTHLGTVQRSAHEALTEMRRLTGVLRDEGAGYRPQPGLERLDELLEGARDGGLAVELEIEGERGEVPAGADLAAFRIVQEALTNARKHAGPVAARVRVRYSDAAVEIEVENELGAGGGSDGSDGGRGLVGMRERVRVYGGELEVGREDGAFRVRARLPLEAER
jgi:signal transduction histidine kinase